LSVPTRNNRKIQVTLQKRCTEKTRLFNLLEDSGKLSEASSSYKNVDSAKGPILGSDDHSIPSPDQSGSSQC
jgi:hypothetical protein